MALNITLTINTTSELTAIVDALEHALDVDLSQLTEDTDLKEHEWNELALRARAGRRVLVNITGKLDYPNIPNTFSERRSARHA